MLVTRAVHGARAQAVSPSAYTYGKYRHSRKIPDENSGCRQKLDRDAAQNRTGLTAENFAGEFLS